MNTRQLEDLLGDPDTWDFIAEHARATRRRARRGSRDHMLLTRLADLAPDLAEWLRVAERRRDLAGVRPAPTPPPYDPARPRAADGRFVQDVAS